MIRAAIQGEAGAFSHAAARQLFGPDVHIVPCVSFDDLFAAVAEGKATHGVVPVENTLAGSVPGNLDRLMESGLHAVSETAVRVELCLMVHPGRSIPEITSAASHPVALQQCRRFFRRHPSIVPVTVYDTAGGVRELMDGGATFDAAIASRLAGELHGAEVAMEGIEDNHENYTRFFSVAVEPVPLVAGTLHACIGFVIEHEPGSLHGVLGHLAGADVNLTRLESRPIPGRPWEYRFYADLSGEHDRLSGALEDVRRSTLELRVLGTYSSS